MSVFSLIRFKDAPDEYKPKKATVGASGYDLCAHISVPLKIEPGKRLTVPTGFGVKLDAGWEAQVRSRSGLAHKYGVWVLNSPGTIDSDYTGQIYVILQNSGDDIFFVQPGMRIAQLVFATVSHVLLTLPVNGDLFDDGDDVRGSKGLGSTGV